MFAASTLQDALIFDIDALTPDSDSSLNIAATLDEHIVAPPYEQDALTLESISSSDVTAVLADSNIAATLDEHIVAPLIDEQETRRIIDSRLYFEYCCIS